MNELTSKLSIIDELVAENLLLKDRINNLEIKVNMLESSKPSDDTEINSIAAEIEERSKRRNNLIICNMEESLSTVRNEIINEDRTRVYNFLKDADNSISHLELRCFRLGKKTNNKPRPIKVILKNPNQVAEVLKGKMNLSHQYKIYRDQTVIQRNQYIKLKEELNARVQNGEKNLVIKFIKGYPKIVNNNNSKNSYATFKTFGV
jgi:chaperonin cofactor prefoldin